MAMIRFQDFKQSPGYTSLPLPSVGSPEAAARMKEGSFLLSGRENVLAVITCFSFQTSQRKNQTFPGGKG